MDLETNYLITADASQVVEENKKVEQGFEKSRVSAESFAKALKAAGNDLSKVSIESKSVAAGLGAMESRLARGRSELAGFARAGVQAKIDIEKLGGVQRMTSAEIDRAINVLGRATRAYETLGRAAPESLDRLKNRLGAIKQANDEMAASSGKVTTAGGIQAAMLSRLTGAFAGLLSARAIYGVIKSTAAYADELKAVSARTGLTVEAVQRLGYAARTNGTSLDKLSSSLSIMQDRLGEGNDKALAALTKLGLTVQQLDKMNPEQQLFAISDGLKRIGSHNEQVATLNDLLGRGGAELLPAFAAGLREAASDADRFGQVMSEKAVESAAEFDTFLKNWGVRVKVTMGETIQDFDTAGERIGKWANGVVENIALSIAAIAQLAGLTSGSSRGPDVLGGSGATSFWPTAPASPNLSGMFGAAPPGANFNPLEKDGLAALMAIDAELENSAREQIRLGRERQRQLEAQAREAERQAKAFEAIQKATVASMMAQKFGDWDFWDVPQSTGIGIGKADWDEFMKTGNLPNAARYGLPGLQERLPNNTKFAPGSPNFRDASLTLPPDVISGQNYERMGLDAGDGFAAGFSDAIGQLLPQAIMQAVTGGGSLVGGIGSAVGTAVGSGVSDMLKVTDFGKTLFGGVLADLLPGVGALLGPLLDRFINKPSMRANDMRDEFISGAGGLDQLNRRAVEAGGNLNWLLRADDPKELQRAIEALTATIEESDRKRREDIQALSGPGLIDPSTVSAVGGRMGFLGGEAERAALEQFRASNLGRAQSGFSGFLDAGGQVSAGNASAFGGGLAAIFGERTGAGESSLAVLRDLDPLIKQLTDQFVALGVDGGAAFSSITSLAIFARDEAVAPAMAQVEALNQILIGLGNTALLDQEMFAGFASQVTATYQSLIDQGKNGDQALQLMQPTLQTLWELEADRGFAVDETTQKMLDQAEAAGLIGDQFRSAEDRMTKAIERLVDRLDLLIAKMFGIGDAAQDAADQANTAFDGIDYPEPPAPRGYPDPDPNTGEPSGAARGGYVTPSGVQYYGFGGPVSPYPGFRFRPQGTDTVPAMLTPGEFVVDRPTVQANGGPGAVRSALSSGGAAAGETNVFVTLYAIDGPSTERFVNSRAFKLAFSNAAKSAELQATHRSIVRSNVKPEARL